MRGGIRQGPRHRSTHHFSSSQRTDPRRPDSDPKTGTEPRVLDHRKYPGRSCSFLSQSQTNPISAQAVSKQPFKILFLCTGNSARSILGEYLIRRISRGRFDSFSAGANPTGKINPIVLRVLKENYKIDASDARSKSWTEYKDVHFDFVITVCDSAQESCPVWPGQPILAHWSSADPAHFEGTEEEKFKMTCQVAMQIQRRLDLFTSLPLEKMEGLRLTAAVSDIGHQ